MTNLVWDDIRPILERDGIKEKRGKWIGNAPSLLSPGSDSGSFVATPYPNMQNGMWNYTAGNRSGTFINDDPAKCLATILGLDKSKYSIGKYYTHKESTNDYLGYAKAHYVDWSVFETAGWTYTASIDNRKPALIVPCRDGINRIRFLDGKSPKWKPATTGATPQWYGLDKAINMRKRVIVICNGQPSVVVAQHYDVPACAITDGENKTPPDGLIAELKRKWQGKIIIAMDCDTAGQGATEKWLSVLPNAIAIDLNGTDGFDLADHCGLFEKQSFSVLLQYANLSQYAELPKNELQKQIDPISDLHKELTQLRNDEIKGDEKRKQEVIKRAQQIIEEYNAQSYGVQLTTGTAEANDLFFSIEDRFDDPRRIMGLTTGFKTLDYSIGGLTSEIMTILAVKGIGKSTLMASIAIHMMLNSNGIIFPTEMRRQDFILMMLARLVSTYERPITTYALRTGFLRQWDTVKDGTKTYRVKCEERLNDNDKKAIQNARRILYGRLSRGAILWPTMASPNPQALYVTVAKAKENKPELKWMLVDSFSHLAGSANGKDERHKLNDMMRIMVDITTQLDIAIIGTAQIGRAVKAREDKRPTEEDAKESGIIEEASSKMFGLYYHHHYVRNGQLKPSDYLPENVASLQLLKGRFTGGEGDTIRLKYRGGAGHWHYDGDIN